MPATASRTEESPVRAAAAGFSRYTRVKRRVRRLVFLAHRWLGVAIALLMALWAVSGVVMMYVAYPETSREERLAGLAPLDLAGCCDDAAFRGRAPIGAATVEMLAGEPVLRWRGPDGAGLAGLSGAVPPAIGAGEAAAIARAHMGSHFDTVPSVEVEPLEVDQWTLQQRRHAPLFKASMADERGTVLYVSGLTGEVVQDTHRTERFWNWLGAVPHWLYFTPLRRDGALWSEVVTYASLLGTFLTVTGLYIGVAMYGRGKRHTPYRGLAAWHHWTGLVFGLFTLTWVVSGLFSMNPWGWFESRGPQAELAALAGRPAEPADVAAFVRALAARPPTGVVSAELAIQGGQAWALLSRADGSVVRASLPDLAPRPLAVSELERRARAARPGTPIASMGLIEQPDAYHFGHKDEVVLPVFRAIYADDGETRIYLDPLTGELAGFADAPRRAFRWWHLGLHRLDFAPWLRARPVWDAVTLPLLLGVVLLCLIGLWLGVRRVRRDMAGGRRVQRS